MFSRTDITIEEGLDRPAHEDAGFFKYMFSQATSLSVACAILAGTNAISDALSNVYSLHDDPNYSEQLVIAITFITFFVSVFIYFNVSRENISTIKDIIAKRELPKKSDENPDGMYPLSKRKLMCLSALTFLIMIWNGTIDSQYSLFVIDSAPSELHFDNDVNPQSNSYTAYRTLGIILSCIVFFSAFVQEGFESFRLGSEILTNEKTDPILYANKYSRIVSPLVSNTLAFFGGGADMINAMFVIDLLGINDPITLWVLRAACVANGVGDFAMYRRLLRGKVNELFEYLIKNRIDAAHFISSLTTVGLSVFVSIYMIDQVKKQFIECVEQYGWKDSKLRDFFIQTLSYGSVAQSTAVSMSALHEICFKLVYLAGEGGKKVKKHVETIPSLTNWISEKFSCLRANSLYRPVPSESPEPAKPTANTAGIKRYNTF